MTGMQTPFNSEFPGKRRTARAGKRPAAKKIAPVLLDLRRAMAGDDRYSRLALAVSEMRRGVQAGADVHVIWPTDREVVVAGALLEQPLASVLQQCKGQGRLFIHMKSGIATHFSRVRPTAPIMFVVHLNAEEAAMQFERADAPPVRRLAAADRLRQMGHAVRVCVGPVRFSRGWKTDYACLFRSMCEYGFHAADVRFESDTFREYITGSCNDNMPGRREFYKLMKAVLSECADHQWFGEAGAA